MDRPSLPRQVDWAVPDNEVLLQFFDDADAIKFREWWKTHGWKSFREWVELTDVSEDDDE